MTTLINAYATVREPPALDFDHVLNARRDQSDPELSEHLQGFGGYIFEHGGGEMTQHLFHVLSHVRRVRHHLSISVEPEALDGFAAWAKAANAICFAPDGSVRAPDGRALILAGGAAPEEGAAVPHPEDAVARRARSIGQLEALGIPLPSGLPPVVGEPEVLLRPAQDAALRASALFLVALRGESLAGGEALEVAELQRRFPHAASALSPKEAEFLATHEPEQQEVINAVWRYEGCALLLWALGRLPELPFPKGVCDVPTVATCMLELGGRLVTDSALRPTAELLDALDLHLRLHWAARDAQLGQTDPPAGLEPGVVVERHHTLNWLVRFQDADWDDVDTPT